MKLSRYRLDTFYCFCGLAALLTVFTINPALARSATQADHVILITLEGVENQVIQSGAMPVLHQLATEGAVTWSAETVRPSYSVSAMASLLTGLPVSKHRIDAEWEHYDFSRSFMRVPTMFDYLDLAGGRDTALFLMDERFYQLSRPEIYVDSQMCGKAKPECSPETVVVYIEDYLKKVTSEGGHGFRLFAVPGLLLVHLPAPADAGQKRGWDSSAYKKALLAVDSAVGDIVKLYQEFGVLDRTMVVVTGLNDGKQGAPQKNGSSMTKGTNGMAVPWFAWGANVKPGYEIKRKVSLIDTGATVMEALGLETHTEWDSQAINEIFQMIPERRTTGNES